MRFRRLSLSVAIAGLTLMTACGNERDDAVVSAPDLTLPAADAPVSGSAPLNSTPVETTPAVTVPKPEVKLPASTPTELVVTVNKEGSGTASKEGDTVVVNYVGVRSADGEMFDNSYDTGSPIPVAPLGTASVIEGWNQGLVGVTPGEQLQLDIPADLAYGEQGRGELIRPGDALSFVIDVVAVIPGVTADDKPDITIAPSANVEALVAEDLVVGTGEPVTNGKHAVLQLVAYRADTGAELVSSYEDGQPIDFVYGEQEVLGGIVEGIKDMKVGGRRRLTIPFAQAFGETGSETIGLPPSTDLVMVVDLTAVY